MAKKPSKTQTAVLNALREFEGGRATSRQLAIATSMAPETVSMAIKGLRDQIAWDRSVPGKGADRTWTIIEPRSAGESTAATRTSLLALRLPVTGPGSEWVLAL